ncbi:MAG: DUF3179 domain-containing protein [Balneolaceae bacterium]
MTYLNTIYTRLIATCIVLFLLVASCDNTTPLSNTDVDGEWLLIKHEIFDGGPGKDGIPSIDQPNFLPANEIDFIPNNRLVIGVNINGEIKVYPHQVLDWHEIVNDRTGDISFSLLYCPLTGTGMAWNRKIDGNVTEFGVSGLLYRNNLIPYDRNTDSHWSQMQLRAVNGPLSSRNIETFQIIETNWGIWKQLYPDSKVLTTNTGHDRDYPGYVYTPGYLTNHNALLFPLSNVDDRLENKTRVHGVIGGGEAINEMKVTAYVIDEFGEGVRLIEDSIASDQYLVVGSTDHNFATAFYRPEDEDLEFEAVQDQLPVIMKDSEGNRWDLFGFAVEGPKKGQRLSAARSYTGYWFAWVDFFFLNIDIYQDE